MIIIILNRIKQKIRLIYIKSGLNNDYKYSFTLALLLSYLDINIPKESEPLIHFSFGIFLLSLIAVSCITNVIGYLTSILLLKYYGIKDKYPKLTKILTYFEKTTIFWIIMEGIVGYVCLFLIIIFSLYILGKPFI
jgi:hypothetical protein